MTNTFNLKNLSDSVADTFDLTKQGAAEVTKFILERIKEELVIGKQVRLHKFGTLSVRVRAAGVARNPVTGEKLTVPSRKGVKLTLSPDLKKLLK